MTYAQPSPVGDDTVSVETTPDIYSDSAADALLTYLLGHADPVAAKATWTAAYPAYAHLWDFRMQFAGLDDQRAEQRHVAARLRQSDLDEAAAVAIREHKHAKLMDAQPALAAEFNMISSDDLDQIESSEPLVENFINKSTLVRMFGASGSKKSFVALDLVGCISAGIEWHGNATYQERALYIAAEGASGIKNRVRAWEKQNGQKFQGLVHDGAVQITDTKQMQRLIAAMKMNDIKFVIFDTQARCTVGLNENDATEMGLMVDALDALRAATDACVMLIHHTGKSDQSNGRGSTAVYGALESELKVSCSGMSVKVETTKQKDDADEDVLALLAVELDVTEAGGRKATSLAVTGGSVAVPGERGEFGSGFTLSPLQTQALIALASCGDVGVSCTGLAKLMGRPGNSMAQDLSPLLTKTVAFRRGTGRGATYFITDNGWSYLGVRSLTTGYHTVEFTPAS